MRNFNVLAAVAAAVLMTGAAAAAKDKPGQRKERKICRTEEMSGRITPRRICRTKSQWEGTAERAPRPAPRAPASDDSADTSARGD